MTSSVSFRITRTAEDLAQTITALSQRLVKLEQRQEALELQLRQQQKDLNAVPNEEISTLEGVEALLRETRELWTAQLRSQSLKWLKTPLSTIPGVRRPKRKRAAMSHRGGARCQNKKKGNYGDHHPCLQCLCFSHLAWHDHLDPVRFS